MRIFDKFQLNHLTALDFILTQPKKMFDFSGVKFFEGVKVERVSTENAKVTGVKTDKGFIDCLFFVNCAGQVICFAT